ncbi:SufE family protein [Candidatus Kapabacteria bacterium]|nr:SufE family protein [Candidatus Kapabacteria bacterium]
MTIDTTLEEIFENFDFLDDWEDKYLYIIDLGRMLPEFDNNLKTPQLLVEGCTSKVWLLSKLANPESKTIEFTAESESQIVKGLVAILIVIYSNKTASEIADIDSEAIFAKLKLAQHLSSNRANGLRAMVERIKTEAINIG